MLGSHGVVNIVGGEQPRAAARFGLPAFVSLVGSLVACGPAPRSETIPVEPATPPVDAAFVERTAMLRATLSRNAIALDETPTITACATAAADKKCLRCELATGMDGIDPELVDRVALVIASYPDKLLRAAQLRSVALCRQLIYVGEAKGPVGAAELSERRMLISVGWLHAHDGRGVEHVVHHELFHLFDLATLGNAMTDRDWLALKPRGFEYKDPAEPAAAPRGFVDAYATTNEIEDRASTFEHLMAEPSICTRMKTDPVVAKKVAIVRARIDKVAGRGFVQRHLRCANAAPTTKRRVPPGKVDLRLRPRD